MVSRGHPHQDIHESRWIHRCKRWESGRAWLGDISVRILWNRQMTGENITKINCEHWSGQWRSLGSIQSIVFEDSKRVPRQRQFANKVPARHLQSDGENIVNLQEPASWLCYSLDGSTITFLSCLRSFHVPVPLSLLACLKNTLIWKQHVSHKLYIDLHDEIIDSWLLMHLNAAELCPIHSLSTSKALVARAGKKSGRWPTVGPFVWQESLIGGFDPFEKKRKKNYQLLS